MSWEKNLHAGRLALARGVYQEAERFLLLAKESAATYGREDSAWADVNRALAQLYVECGKLDAAQTAANEALAGDQSYWGMECDQVAEDCFWLGESFRLQWDFERAKPWFERALNFREQRYGTTHDTTLAVLGRLLMVYLQSGQTNGVEAIHAKTYEGFQATHPSGMWGTFLRLHEVAKVYVEAGKDRELQELLHREAALLKKQVGATHKEVASVLAIEAEVLKGAQRKLAAWSVGNKAQQVEKANNLSLFASDERMFKLPAPKIEEAVEQLLIVPMQSFGVPAAVKRARWRFSVKQPGEPLIGSLLYDDGTGSGQQAELKLTLRVQPRGPACAATFQWQVFSSSNMHLAKAVTAYVLKEIDDNVLIMPAMFDLPAGFSNPGASSFAGSAAQPAWPTPQQFNEAVQNPRSAFIDEVLKGCEPELNPIGLPKPYSGAFATVYCLQHDGLDRAVKCFTTRVSDQQQRYAEISRTLLELKSPHFVQFEYQSEGIAVGASKYPILKMDWARGESLISYIEDNLSNREKLQALAVRFLKMMLQLQKAGIAHGDLQHGNLIICDDEVKLVDYDAMYVPALSGWKSNELGHRNYQHPKRSAQHFNAELDNFSAWVIYTSLICLSRAPQLWNVLQAGEESLLFKQADFTDPGRSNAFRLLSAEADPDVKAAIRFFSEVVRQPMEEVPSVSTVVV